MSDLELHYGPEALHRLEQANQGLREERYLVTLLRQLISKFARRNSNG